MRLLVFVAIAALHTPTFADMAADFIKRYEGFKSSAYLCQAGEWAIGYGFTDKKLIAKGYIYQTEADIELIRICGEIRNRLRKELKRQRLTENEETAVISFIYNVGWYNFKCSKMFRLIIHGKRGSIVANEFRRWVYVTQNGRKVKSRGIQRRRIAEASMFAGSW
jgi:lysozyme